MTQPPFYARPRFQMAALAAAVVGTVLVLALNASIAARKAEGRQTSMRVVDLDENTVDPVLWGKNFPKQFDGYQRTSER